MEVGRSVEFGMMESHGISSAAAVQQQNMINSSDDVDMDLRRGPWTVEEDLILVNYITNHGEGRWNSLARCAGLKRTGKSCRLRWLNYLRPDVRRGNITPEEQLLILELHSRWGNRWSKIAQHLPGRTDNEIKNYWRTRVQKHAKQLQCDVNSKQFKDVMRYLWMPRLIERIRAANNSSNNNSSSASSSPAAANTTSAAYIATIAPTAGSVPTVSDGRDLFVHVNLSPESSSVAASSTTTTSDSFDMQQQFTSPLMVPTTQDSQFYQHCMNNNNEGFAGDWPETLLSPTEVAWPEFDQTAEWCGSDMYESLWTSMEDSSDWFSQQ